MKPFNLEAALAGEKVITRNGQEVTDLHWFKNATNNDYPLWGVVDKNILTWNLKGGFRNSSESPTDLFMAPKVKTYWANVFEIHGDKYINGPYHSKETALELTNSVYNYIKTISFEIEE